MAELYMQVPEDEWNEIIDKLAKLETPAPCPEWLVRVASELGSVKVAGDIVQDPTWISFKNAAGKVNAMFKRELVISIRRLAC